MYDYIIVGAGSAGCVLANRLSSDPRNKVLLIEAGGNYNESIFVRMPSALSYPMNMSRYNWGYQSLKEDFLNERKLNCPRGKGLGGSSSINGMVYVRGHPKDFDQWEVCGAKGWNYSTCLPYFKKMENWIGQSDQYRSKDGLLNVCLGNEMKNPLYSSFIQAGIEAGYSYTSDYNGYKQEGFAPMQMTVKVGSRCSSYTAYLKDIRSRNNLKIMTNALANKVIFKNSKAIAVEVICKREVLKIVASKEVVISAGSIGSPLMLQRSGVGPGDLLSSLNIGIVKVLPGVGKNLQDHLEVYFQYICKQPITLNNKLDYLSKFVIGMKWLIAKKGLGSTNHFESCAFIRSRSGLNYPDIQYHFLPAAVSYDGKSLFQGHGFQVHVGPNKPKSRGVVSIQSKNCFDKPFINFNYLQDKNDILDWRRCIRLTHEIIQQPAMDKFRGNVIQPVINLDIDEEIDSWVRNNVESAYHPCGTCRMGDPQDANTVVDDQCRIIGLKNIRVVDSSIFPEITNGNLNAPTIMTAEKVSDMLLGNKQLKNNDFQVWCPSDWETSQRENNPCRKI